MAAILAGALLAMPLAASAAEQDRNAGAVPKSCSLDPIEQSYRWERRFQGIEAPVTWTVRRRIEFETVEGLIEARERLRLDLPDFRWRFQRYVNSANVDSCETRFYVRARTPTADGNALLMPLVVDFQRARCALVDETCIESAALIGECRSVDRKIRIDESAELDVAYHVGFNPVALAPQVETRVVDVYGRLKDREGRRYLDDVARQGAVALEQLVGSLGEVSLARLSPDLEPVAVRGGFVDETAGTFTLEGDYVLSERQVCRARLALESFAQRHRRSASTQGR